eukprot:TRINITY_DN100147_c0_g1_i1.p2 TRINITY_DN100147_c0_g1~~TRINITY_DN100147_c0_g1_i1.p2  ORF type:complete len:169 (-),score=22.42 TRINITY_DN100147_c0_g1_i1:138-596(-)
MKNFKSAQELMQKCVNIRKQIERGGGQGTGAALESQGSILIQAGHHQKATQVLTECVDVTNRRLKNDISLANQVDLAKPYKLLSQAYTEIGDKEQQEYFNQKYEQILTEVPSDHPSLHWVKKMEEHGQQVQLYLSHKGVPPISDLQELEGML